MTIPANVHNIDEVRKALAAVSRNLKSLTAIAGRNSIADLDDVNPTAASRFQQKPVDKDVLAWDKKTGKWIYQNAVELAYDHGALAGRDDDDHTLYSLVDGTRAFTAPVGGVVPVGDSDLTTKEYVDLTAGFHFEYHLTDTASVATYFVMQDSETGEAQSSHTLGSAGGGDDQLIAAFITPSGEPGVLALDGGVYSGHFHVERTSGNRTVTVYWTLSSYALDTTETLLMTSHESSAVTDEVELDLHANLAAAVTLLTTDRLVLKVYANLSATPSSATTVVLYQEGTTASHFIIGVDSGILNNLYVRQDGTLPLSADWDAGSFKITAEQLESDIATGTAPLIVSSNTVVPNLNADLLDGNHAAAFATAGDLSTHMADTTDPHGASMSVNTEVITPQIAYAGVVTLDAYNPGASSTIYMRNSGGQPVTVQVLGSLEITGTVDGRDIDADGTKLDTIETSADVTDATNVDAALPTKLRTVTKTPYIEFPIVGDSYPSGFIADNITMVQVRGVTDTGTVDFNIEYRDTDTPDVIGTDILTSDLPAVAAGASSTTFDNNGDVPAETWLTFTISATSGNPTKLWVVIEYTID